MEKKKKNEFEGHLMLGEFHESFVSPSSILVKNEKFLS